MTDDIERVLAEYVTCRRDTRRLAIRDGPPPHEQIIIQTRIDGEWRDGRWTENPEREQLSGDTVFDEICEGYTIPEEEDDSHV